MKYKVVERKKPGTQDFKYYGTVVLGEPVGLRAIIKEIEEKCTLTQADIVAVLFALESAVSKHLLNGQSVRFGTLGSFRPTITSEGASAGSVWAPTMVKKVRAVFTPAGQRKQKLTLKNCNPTKAE